MKTNELQTLLDSLNNAYYEIETITLELDSVLTELRKAVVSINNAKKAGEKFDSSKYVCLSVLANRIENSIFTEQTIKNMSDIPYLMLVNDIESINDTMIPKNETH